MGKQGLFSFITAFFLIALLAGCGVFPSQGPSNIGECVFPTSAPKLYGIQAEDWVRGVYNHVAMADLASQESRYKEARYAAFLILGKQVQRWSDYVDVGLPDGGNVRITITYLSPQLIETILLNTMLVNREIYYSDLDFVTRISGKLAEIDNRNTVVFNVAITALHYGNSADNQSPITVDIPLNDLKLTNSANQVAQTKYDDHSLDNPIYLTHGPFSGQINYQMTVKNGDGCGLFLDPRVNNTISIHLEGLKINNVDAGPLTWTIRYASLLGGTGPGEAPIFAISNPPPDFNLLVPASSAPAPMILSAGDPKYWDSYWQLMACYIWEQVTFANSP
jgi:hypothetical protein